MRQTMRGRRERMAGLGRREVLRVLGGAGVGRPVMALAEQSAKLPTIGFLGSTTPSVASLYTSAFAQRLRDLGWTEGRNVATEYRWVEGHAERAAEIASEFVRLKVNVIVTSGTGNI